MEDLLIATIETLGYPVRRQGSFASDETYPDDFFTYWNNASDDGSHYDNAATSTIWDFDVNFYSINTSRTYSELAKCKKALKNAGFIISGNGYDVMSDEPTHTGRGMNALYLEIN